MLECERNCSCDGEDKGDEYVDVDGDNNCDSDDGEGS